jgi:hypothetical protein
MLAMRGCAALAAAAIAAGFATVATAAPLGTLAQSIGTSEAGSVRKVHGCHFDLGTGMAADPADGPHYHDNQCRVVRVGTQGGYQQRDYYDEPRRNRRADEAPPYPGDPSLRYRQPAPGYGYGPPPAPPPEQICYKRCRYRGPIKICKTVCE